MISVDELMTPNPYTLSGSEPLNTAWKIMADKHIRHIPITDDDNHVIGLITQRDVLAATRPSSIFEAISELDDDISNIKLSDIMIKNVAVIHKNDNLRQAALHMQLHKHGCLPVVFDDRLVGIITDSDFVAIAINLLEQVELQEELQEELVENNEMLDEIEIPGIVGDE